MSISCVCFLRIVWHIYTNMLCTSDTYYDIFSSTGYFLLEISADLVMLMSCRVTVEERKSSNVECGQVFDEISSCHVAYGKVNLMR